MKSSFAIDLEKMSRTANTGIVLLCGFFGIAGYFVVLVSRRKEIPFVGDTL